MHHFISSVLMGLWVLRFEKRTCVKAHAGVQQHLLTYMTLIFHFTHLTFVFFQEQLDEARCEIPFLELIHADIIITFLVESRLFFDGFIKEWGKLSKFSYPLARVKYVMHYSLAWTCFICVALLGSLDASALILNEPTHCKPSTLSHVHL